jgi:hypothetical protein
MPIVSSPVSPLGFHSQGQHLYGKHEDPLVDWAPPWTNPRDVCDSSLPWWRAAIRRKLVASVQGESGVIARMQVSIKNSYSLRWHPNHYIGKNPHSMVRCIFRLHLISRYTYVFHDRTSGHVFPEMGRGCVKTDTFQRTS